MQITETIFNYHPTEEELDQLIGEAFMSEAEYEACLAERSSASNTTVDYEKVIDLEELFTMRKNKAKAKYYAVLIATEFSEVHNRFFNE